MGWLGEERFQIGWVHDHSAAYLFCCYKLHANLAARWICNRPELTTFDPARWRLGLAVAAEGGTLYDATPMTRGIFRGL